MDRGERLSAGDVDERHRLEVQDDDLGRRVGRPDAPEQLLLEDVGIGEDQLRLEAIDQHPRHRGRVLVVLEIAEARAVAAAPELGDVWVVDRVDQQDEAERDPDGDPRKDVDEDHAQQRAERRPELERPGAPVPRDALGVDVPRHGPDDDRAQD